MDLQGPQAPQDRLVHLDFVDLEDHLDSQENKAHKVNQGSKVR